MLTMAVPRQKARPFHFQEQIKMNADKFFNQIRTYINNNATHANDVARSDARTCGANNISVFAGNYEFAIESRCAGRGYVTVRRDQAIIANQSTLNYLFNADDAIGATLAILEKQDNQRGEDARALGDDVPLQMDVNDERQAQFFGITRHGFQRIEKMLGRALTETERDKFNQDFIEQCEGGQL